MRLGAHSVFAVAFWLWSAFVAIGAGFVGSALNCESGEGCTPGSPSWLQPWTWGDFYVYPEAAVIGFAALVPATAFVLFAVAGRLVPALAALLGCLVLLSYPYFGGLTTEGRTILCFGPVVGFGALLTSRSRTRFARRS